MKSQRGMALLTVLMMVAMMTLVAVAVQHNWVDALRQAQSLAFHQQAKWTLAGAEQWLLAAPSRLAENGKQALILEGSTVHYRWRDRQNCFNLNALAPHGKVSPQGDYWPTAAQQVFIALLVQHRVSAAEAEEKARQIAGLLNPQSLRNPAPVLEDKTQLREVVAIDSALWAALSPLLCVQPETRLRLNLNALSPRELPLLASLLGGRRDASALATVLARRPAGGWHDLSAFMASLPFDAADASSTLQSAAVFASQEWELQLWIAQENRIAALSSRISEQDGKRVIRYRHYGLSEE